MLTLSYGYKKPQNTDRGPIVFPAMEQNIQGLNDHTHNGTNSAKIGPSSGVAVVQTLIPANWVLVANGIYKQTVTVPAGTFFSDVARMFLLSDGSQFYPTVKKITELSYEIYINDNTETVTVLSR
jgi:hypothetical protein